MVLWAANFIVVKSALAVLPPVGFTFLRFAIASVTLFALLRWREGSVGLPRRDLLGIAGLGALGFGIYQILWTTGLSTIPAGDSALIIASTPVLVAFLAVLARSDVLTPAKLGGGADLVRRRRDRHRVGIRAEPRQRARGRGDHAPRRVLLVGLPRLRRAVPRSLQPAAGDGLGHGRRDDRARPDRDRPALERGDRRTSRPRSSAPSCIPGFLAAGVSNVIVQNGVRVVGPTRTSAYQFLVPALAVVLAAIFLSEPIRAGQVVGGLVIVAGVLITRGGLPSGLVRSTR